MNLWSKYWNLRWGLEGLKVEYSTRKSMLLAMLDQKCVSKSWIIGWRDRQSFVKVKPDGCEANFSMYHTLSNAPYIDCTCPSPSPSCRDNNWACNGRFVGSEFARVWCDHGISYLSCSELSFDLLDTIQENPSWSNRASNQAFQENVQPRPRDRDPHSPLLGTAQDRDQERQPDVTFHSLQIKTPKNTGVKPVLWLESSRWNAAGWRATGDGMIAARIWRWWYIGRC
jgi:hypothetical protein